MTNETPVMFEYGGTETPWNANATHSIKYDEQVECFCVFELTDRGVKTFRFVNDYDLNAFFEAKTMAKLKAQGWLSPADQRPFCMESAKELGVEFENSRDYVKPSHAPLYMVKFKSHSVPSFCRYVEGYNSFEDTDCRDFYCVLTGQAIDCHKAVWFMPYNNHPECARLDALGVKRYEQGGGEG